MRLTSGPTWSLLTILTLTLGNVVWLGALLLPSPQTHPASLAKSAFVRIHEDQRRDVTANIDQTVSVYSERRAREYLTISLWDTQTGAAIPITRVDLGQSQRAHDAGWDCVIGGQSSAYPDPRGSSTSWASTEKAQLRAAYERNRALRASGTWLAPLVTAQSFTPATNDINYLDCNADFSLVNQKQATEVVVPTLVALQIIGSDDNVLVKPNYSLTTPSSWSRQDANAEVVSGSTFAESTTDERVADPRYLESPLGSSYAFIDPERQRLIDIAVSALLLFTGSLVAVGLDRITSRPHPRTAASASGGAHVPLLRHHLRPTIRRRRRNQ